jgi:hypothetical protein
MNEESHPASWQLECLQCEKMSKQCNTKPRAIASWNDAVKQAEEVMVQKNKSKKDKKLLPCICGNESPKYIHFEDSEWYVVCDNHDAFCWSGPTKKSKKKAQKAWNKLMGR